MIRYDLEFKQGSEMFARMTLDLNENVDIYDKAQAILSATAEDNKAYVDVYSKGQFIVRLHK